MLLKGESKTKPHATDLQKRSARKFSNTTTLYFWKYSFAGVIQTACNVLNVKQQLRPQEVNQLPNEAATRATACALELATLASCPRAPPLASNENSSMDSNALASTMVCTKSSPIASVPSARFALSTHLTICNASAPPSSAGELKDAGAPGSSADALADLHVGHNRFRVVVS